MTVKKIITHTPMFLSFVYEDFDASNFKFENTISFNCEEYEICSIIFLISGHFTILWFKLEYHGIELNCSYHDGTRNKGRIMPLDKQIHLGTFINNKSPYMLTYRKIY